MKVYAIYDSKGQFFDRPFIQRNAGDATRGFQMAVNDEKNDSMIKRFPADYTLFELGTWDEINGVISMHEAKVNLGTGLQFKNEKLKQVTQ